MASTVPMVFTTISRCTGRAVQRPQTGGQTRVAPRSLHPAGTVTQHHSRSWRIDAASPPPSPLPRTLSGTRFSQLGEPNGAIGSPGLFPSLPKSSRVQHQLLAEGMEPGNLAFLCPVSSQEKGEFWSQTGSAPKSPRIWLWQGRDRQHRAISKQRFFSKTKRNLCQKMLFRSLQQPQVVLKRRFVFRRTQI